MTQSDSDAVRASRDRAKTRIIGPVARDLRKAGVLSVLAGMLWPIQAAVLAWAVSGWAARAAPFVVAWIAAALFFLCALYPQDGSTCRSRWSGSQGGEPTFAADASSFSIGDCRENYAPYRRPKRPVLGLPVNTVRDT